MRRPGSFVLACALALAAVPALSQEKKEGGVKEPLLWHVTGKKGEVWLLGSIHVASKDFYPLPGAVEKAFEKAKYLVVEADVEKGDAEETQKLVMERGLYGEGDSLDQHLSKESWEALETALGKFGVGVDAVKNLKPWLVAIQLTALATQKAGLDASQGIDRHFLVAAKKQKKEILELESAKEQIELISGFSPELQEKFLKSTLEDVKQLGEEMKKLVETYREGDPKKLEELVLKGAKDEELKPVMTKLFDDRNEKMTAKIVKWLDEDAGPHFVVVGAGHLVGEKGIVKLLEAKKLTVERVKK